MYVIIIKDVKFVFFLDDFLELQNGKTSIARIETFIDGIYIKLVNFVTYCFLVGFDVQWSFITKTMLSESKSQSINEWSFCSCQHFRLFRSRFGSSYFLFTIIFFFVVGEIFIYPWLEFKCGTVVSVYSFAAIMTLPTNIKGNFIKKIAQITQ